MTKERSGFGGLPCPKCGDADALITLDLDDLATFRCTECEEEFVAEDVRRWLDRWQRVLTWLEASPAPEPAP